jgi:uncharacterized protein (UPF0335 family)
MATSAALQEEPATKFAKDQLKAIVERIERLEEEKKTISDDIRDVYAEAKGNGYDVKALRTIVRLRKQDANERAEQETILETYMQALGMLYGGRAPPPRRGPCLETVPITAGVDILCMGLFSRFCVCPSTARGCAVQTLTASRFNFNPSCFRRGRRRAHGNRVNLR